MTHKCEDVRWVECLCACHRASETGEVSTRCVICQRCDATGLRFPNLSRKCPGDTDSWEDPDYDIEGEDGQDGIRYYNIGPVEISKHIPCLGEFQPNSDILGRGEYCPQCGSKNVYKGLGRLPVDDLEVWWDLVPECVVKQIYYDGPQTRIEVWWRAMNVIMGNTIGISNPKGDGNPLKEAIAEALCKALNLHE